MLIQNAARKLALRNAGSAARFSLPSASVLCQQLVDANIPVSSATQQQQRTLFGKTLYNLARGVMPPISKTEQVALGCGTIGFDRDIFTGNPSLEKLIQTYQPKLSEDEQSFLNHQVNELCALLNDHDVTLKKDFSREAWDYMRDERFFSMKIPKEYGGLGFSTHAVSMVLVKLATHCSDAFSTVAVPNSLGPGELLARYGTPSQKDYFLPRLADGTLIPCFGLTGPHSGSDATSLIGSHGVVTKRNGELGILASFDKRYITLAPVAGCVGIGLDISDPDNLLHDCGEEGFSVALLERDHEGLEMGPRHMPLNAAFMNGTVKGTDVWIPMDSILGGQERVGFGWHMFVECLAEGRGVSLPASAIGAARGVAAGVGAYARVRKQFRVPIAEFGGIQEALATSGSDGLINIAGGDLMNAIVDNHEAPMVVSSIMKQNCTERGRRIMERGMDIAAGSAICRGDNNYLGNHYMNMPIAITVEGANIMTRSFQIIGQGLTRCHPHMLELIYSLQDEKRSKESVATFNTQLGKVIAHGVTNFANSIGRGVGSVVSTKLRSKTEYKDGNKLLDYHEKQLLRLSANFAITADLCFTLGGKLKFEELLMGRLADCMGAIFLGYATLHHYHRRRGIEGLEAATEHAMLRLEKEAQEALEEAARNFPGPLGGFASVMMRLACFPLGGMSHNYVLPDDYLTKEVSRLITTPSGLRNFFQEGLYTAPEGTRHQVSDLIRALPVCMEADAIQRLLKKENRQPTHDEVRKMANADELRDTLIQVNVFEKFPEEEAEGYIRPALAGTADRLEAQDRKSFAA